MRLILVRHGESHHAKRGVIVGDVGCTGLTDRGIDQADRLANRFRLTGEVEDGVALLSSPFLRAYQTAEVLEKALPGSRIEIDNDLVEVRPGRADGLSWNEYRSRFGAFDLPAEPERPFAPGGESWSDFVRRVRAVLDRLAERFDGQTVVAVTHAGFIVLTLLDLFSIPPAVKRARLDPIHTSLTEWQVSNNVWRLERYNDAYHLLDRHSAKE